MIKVAILDDYQNVFQEFVDLKKLEGKYEIKIFLIRNSAALKKQEKKVFIKKLFFVFLDKN